MQKARRFAGGTNKLAIPYAAPFQVVMAGGNTPGAALSVSIWFRLQSVPGTLMTLHTNAATGSNVDGVKIGVNGTSLLVEGGTGGAPGSTNRKTFTKNVTWSTGHWYHCLVTVFAFSTTFDADAWLDGVDQNITLLSGSGSKVDYSANNDGWIGNSGGWGGFSGDIGGVAFWNSQLGQTQATSLAACGDPLTTSASSLVAYWPIEGTSPETDTTGNGHDATVSGTTVVTDGPCAVAAPSAPTNPAAAALSSTSIRVTWDNVANETGYRVERSPDGTTGWTDVSGSLAADTTQYDDTGLTASTQYFYRVFAFNAGGDSPASTVVNATTDAGPVPPSGGGNRMGGTGAIRRSSETTQRLVRRGR